MIRVLGLAAVIWVCGRWVGLNRLVRSVLLLILLAAVVGIQLIFPDGHPLRVATGGRLEHWVLVLGAGFLVLLYARGVVALKARARVDAPAAPASEDGLSTAALRRYSRHIMLREIGGPGQVRLSQARVLVIGAGGLGAPVLMYLAASGVGTLGVMDDDEVELSNLQRQIIHREGQIGARKVDSAKAMIADLTSHVRVVPYAVRFDAAQADLLAGYDLVIDGCDNFESRAAVNRACVAAGVPLISGAISQWEGQVSLFDPARGGPCYGCVFPQAPAPGLAPSCAQAGVLAPLPGVIGAMMAAEAVKYLTGAGETLRGRMVIHDALYAETREVRLARDPACPVCGGRA